MRVCDTPAHGEAFFWNLPFGREGDNGNGRSSISRLIPNIIMLSYLWLEGWR